VPAAPSVPWPRPGGAAPASGASPRRGAGRQALGSRSAAPWRARLRSSSAGEPGSIRVRIFVFPGGAFPGCVEQTPARHSNAVQERSIGARRSMGRDTSGRGRRSARASAAGGHRQVAQATTWDYARGALGHDAVVQDVPLHGLARAPATERGTSRKRWPSRMKQASAKINA